MDAVAGVEVRLGGALWLRLGRYRPADAPKHRPCSMVHLQKVEEAALPGRAILRVIQLADLPRRTAE